MKVDIIIPTFKPKPDFRRLIEALNRQTYPINRIHIINTEKRYFDSALTGKQGNLCITHILRSEFDHGGTRRKAAMDTDTDILLFMTQDALPFDNRLVENLIKPFMESEKAGAVYARQLPEDNCSPIEYLTRSFNYPEKNQVKTFEDRERLGIKTYFCSNVCAAYRKSVYEKLGGFEERAIFNEDMIMAYKIIQAGYSIVYEADAMVIHSHNYSLTEQFKRNFDIAVSHVQNPEVFREVKAEGEGVRYVKQVMRALRKMHKSYLVPYFVIQSGFKLAGFKLGQHYNRIPYRIIKKLTFNPGYWVK